MTNLYGRNWTRRELAERVGDLAQIAGAESFTFNDGVRDGVRGVRVRSGGGLDFTVLLSRGMDIGQASFNGVPLAWVSQTGAVHPHAFDAEARGGRDWLRSFHGGLLTGCGLSNAGAANVDDDEALGIHGYLSHIPAEETRAQTVWDGDNAVVTVQGTMREARVFGENLRLTRTITVPVGGSSLTIHDRAENVGFTRAPLMLLYHLNFGWPLVSEDTEIIVSSRGPAVPRDAIAETGLGSWNRLTAPQDGYAEQCFFHDARADENDVARVLMVNRARPLGVEIAYEQATLPFLTEWKMMGRGEYVCGIEPANCLVLGRAEERAAGRLQHLEPGETRDFRVTLSVLEGADAIARVEERARAK